MPLIISFYFCRSALYKLHWQCEPVSATFKNLENREGEQQDFFTFVSRSSLMIVAVRCM